MKNTAGKAIGQAMVKLDIQLEMKFSKPLLIAVKTPDMINAMLNDMSSENNKLVCLGWMRIST